MLKKLYKVFFMRYLLLCAHHLLSFIIRVVQHSQNYTNLTPRQAIIHSLIEALKELEEHEVSRISQTRPEIS